MKPRLKRGDSLIGQIVVANLVLVALTIAGTTLASGLDLSVDKQRWEFLVLAMAIALTLSVNLWILQRRFAPLERLIEQVEAIDPADPGGFKPAADPVEEIDRLSRSFKRLIERIDEERRRAGRLVVTAQEGERRRLARDLHDEVNQALTAILLRLEALGHDLPSEHVAQVGELKRLANQAMEELLNLARQLRPTALDDHGLVPAIDTQLRRFESQTGIAVTLEASGDATALGDEEQTAIYRVAQEALNNIGRHAGATQVEVHLAASDEGAELHVRDDGAGFDTRTTVNGGLGLSGMAERARLLGGELDVRSAPGEGTSVTLRVP